MQTLNVLHFRGWQSPREERDTDVFDPSEFARFTRPARRYDVPHRAGYGKRLRHTIARE